MDIKNKISDFICYLELEKEKNSNLKKWLDVNSLFFDQINHGKWPELVENLSKLPEISQNITAELNSEIVRVQGEYLGEEEKLINILKKLAPWRKGPYSLYDIFIDTEWRSDHKWARLESHISPLNGRHVLDVGTGSGYHLWRMLGAGAHSAVGIEPTVTFIAQFYAVAHLLGESRALIIPTTLEESDRHPIFDTVFSMGVLYHRRSPIHHLQELGECLKPGGELVLETLVLSNEDQNVLTPDDRYAAMRNVWFIPSIPLLSTWLKRTGFTLIRVVNMEYTALEEQRATQWTDFKPSLVDFLDPNDYKKTIEGYPAPLRAVILARKK